MKLQTDKDMQEVENQEDIAVTVSSAVGDGQQNRNVLEIFNTDEVECETATATPEIAQVVVLRTTEEEDKVQESHEENIEDSAAEELLEVQQANDELEFEAEIKRKDAKKQAELELETEIKRKAAERAELEEEKGILLRGKMARVREAQRKFFLRDHKKNRENDCGLSERARRRLSTLSISSTSSKESEQGRCGTPTKSLFEEDMGNYQLKERLPQSQIVVTNGGTLEEEEILMIVDMTGRKKDLDGAHSSTHARLSTAAKDAFLFHYKKELSAIIASPYTETLDQLPFQRSSHLSTTYGHYRGGFITADHTNVQIDQNLNGQGSSRDGYDNQRSPQLQQIKKQRKAYSVRFAKGTKYANASQNGGRKVRKVSAEAQGSPEDPDGIVVLEAFEDDDEDDIPPRDNRDFKSTGAGEQKTTVEMEEEKVKERLWEKFLFYACCGVCIICTNKY